MDASAGQVNVGLDEKRRLAEAFRCDGFIGPLKLFTPAQCRLIARHDHYGKHPKPQDWSKCRAVTERFFYNLATRPRLLDLVKLCLGENCIVWGASIVTRDPGQVHPWHTDIETSDRRARAVSLWIGIDHTVPGATPQFISRTHLAGQPIQQIAHDNGLKRGEVSTPIALEWAQWIDPDAALQAPAMQDGDALLFDGRLWHGVPNDHATGIRKALLLQYATTKTAIRMPDFSQLEWPFRFRTEPLPPVIRVSGAGGHRLNRLVDPPLPEKKTDAVLATEIRPINLPLHENHDKGWQPYHLLRGRTRNIDFMSCHVSILSPGHSPHPPHVHLHDEILLVLDGEAELIISDDEVAEEPTIEILRPGSFVYYPAYQFHTIRNVSRSPVTYMMFRWHGPPGEVEDPMGWKIFGYAGIEAPPNPKKFFGHVLFERSTAYLEKLHAHFTILQPGGGYKVHVDRHDVAILTLTGMVETLGRRVPPHNVIYYSGGESHGMRNVGAEVARYLVFEFHGHEYREPRDVPTKQVRRLTDRISRPLMAVSRRLGRFGKRSVSNPK